LERTETKSGGKTAVGKSVSRDEKRDGIEMKHAETLKS
jgi:hypothetical protein